LTVRSALPAITQQEYRLPEGTGSVGANHLDTAREATMRKFLFSGAMLGALFGGVGVVQTTLRGPRDWRLILMWISWACSIAIAAGTIVKNAETHELEN